MDISSAAVCFSLCCALWQGDTDRATAGSHTAEEHGQGHVTCNAAGAQAFSHLLCMLKVCLLDAMPMRSAPAVHMRSVETPWDCLRLQTESECGKLIVQNSQEQITTSK